MDKMESLGNEGSKENNTSKSDVHAKKRFKKLLENKFVIQNWNEKKNGKCPADIYAQHKDSGEFYYFEIKKTSSKIKEKNVLGPLHSQNGELLWRIKVIISL